MKRFLSRIKVPAKVMFITSSILATIWFLVRVIPKPSRATYPCMQVAAPIMSSFVIWLLSLSGIALAFRKIKQKLFAAKYAAAFLFLVLGLGAFSLLSLNTSPEASAGELEIWYKANMPMGDAKGNFPGRVVLELWMITMPTSTHPGR